MASGMFSLRRSRPYMEPQGSPISRAAIIASEEAHQARVEENPPGPAQASLHDPFWSRSLKHPLVDANGTQKIRDVDLLLHSGVPRWNKERTGLSVLASGREFGWRQLRRDADGDHWYELCPACLVELAVEVTGVTDHQPMAVGMIDGAGLPVIENYWNLRRQLDHIALADVPQFGGRAIATPLVERRRDLGMAREALDLGNEIVEVVDRRQRSPCAAITEDRPRDDAEIVSRG
jgi:hypothetical protein